MMTKIIPSEVHNELRLQFKKGEALTLVKELCEKYKDNIQEFTSSAIMSAYQVNRPKAVDYMLGLEERQEASLIVKIHIQSMIYDQKQFDKGAKMLSVICKHFPRIFILQEIEKCMPYQDPDQQKR